MGMKILVVMITSKIRTLEIDLELHRSLRNCWRVYGQNLMGDGQMTILSALRLPKGESYPKKPKKMAKLTVRVHSQILKPHASSARACMPLWWPGSERGGLGEIRSLPRHYAKMHVSITDTWVRTGP